MKYMGSKRTMLQNGLGGVLRTETSSATRMIDLFCGGASVSWFAATELGKRVVACDLQTYASILAGAVVKRTKPLEFAKLNELWLEHALQTRFKLKGWRLAKEVDGSAKCPATWQRSAQELCSSDVAERTSVVWRCYGGYYFSPTQALSLDAMLLSLPKESRLRELCIAATIIAASRCAAAPGHTAQPFKATHSAAKYLRESWLRDPFHYARIALKRLCPMHALEPGDAVVGDANQIAMELGSDDVVFVDPPYSAVQYSRFYHVLETIARGKCSVVSGAGRYPPLEERPNSLYSRKGGSTQAIYNLLEVLANRGCTVILTFPEATCSNGLSGEAIGDMARRLFHVKRKTVTTRFSTLGGNTINRTARTTSDELMLVLKSK